MVSKLCFIDWDDTLFCSTWLASMKKVFGSDMNALRPSFESLENAICNLLDTVHKSGYKTYIVTNSETGWVELSAKRHVPTVLDKLAEINVPIISARSQYEKLHGPSGLANMESWKKEAIVNLLQPFCLAGNHTGQDTIYDVCGYISSDPTGFVFDQIHNDSMIVKVNLLVIGDSPLDVQAAESAAVIPSVNVKIFKCDENPDIFGIISQLNHISANFVSIASNENFCIRISEQHSPA